MSARIQRFIRDDVITPFLLLSVVIVTLSDGLFRKVQSIKNAAARLVTGTRRCDHITPVLCQLHQSLAGQTPAYLADDIQFVTDTDRRPLRSAAVRTCIVRRTHNSFGD